MDELPMSKTANGSLLYLYGTRSVSLTLRNGATMSIFLIVCDTQYPIALVNRLRERAKRAVCEKKYDREAIYSGFVLWAMAIFIWFPISTPLANNYEVKVDMLFGEVTTT